MPEPRSTPVTVPSVRAAKRRDGHPPLVMVTAYDAPGARIADAAGVDLILVGDSVGNNVLGYEDNLQVTMEDMAHHTAAVARAKPKPLIVADLPWMSYHLDPVDTVRNAAVLIRAGAQAVKLEGGANRVPMIEALVAAEIPVMGHLGLTPQSVNVMGGYRVQGRDDAAAHMPGRRRQGHRRPPVVSPWSSRGCPGRSERRSPSRWTCRPSGSGPDPDCDGQVLVFHDLLGFNAWVPKFVRRYAELGTARLPRRWRPTPPTCGPGAFPADAEVLPLSAGSRCRRRFRTAGAFAGKVVRSSSAACGRPSSSDLPHVVGLGRPT